MVRGWLITHKDCLDGATAALYGVSCGLEPIFVEPDRVTDGLNQISDQKPIYLADVSLRPDDWSYWSSRITHLLDHHQSALYLGSDRRATIDQSRSGAHLMYDFVLHEGWIRNTAAKHRLALAVERYDLWKPQHDLGQDLNRLFHHLGYEWYLNRFSEGLNPFQPVEADLLAHLIREEKAYVKKYLAMAERYQEALPFPIYGVTLEDEGPVNVVSHTLIEQGAALVIVVKPEGRLSARSDSRVNAAQLMEDLFSGGGHARAAGGRLKESQSLSSLLKDVSTHLSHVTIGPKLQ